MNNFMLNHGRSLRQVVVTVAAFEEVLDKLVIVHVTLEVRSVRCFVGTYVTLLLSVFKVKCLILRLIDERIAWRFY
jgi:hypothetical protein